MPRRIARTRNVLQHAVRTSQPEISGFTPVCILYSTWCTESDCIRLVGARAVVTQLWDGTREVVPARYQHDERFQ